MHVAALPNQAPVIGNPPSHELEIGGPIRHLLCTTEDDHDRLVVGRQKGLGVLNGIEYRPPGHRVVSLEEGATYGTFKQRDRNVNQCR